MVVVSNMFVVLDENLCSKKQGEIATVNPMYLGVILITPCIYNDPASKRHAHKKHSSPPLQPPPPKKRCFRLSPVRVLKLMGKKLIHLENLGIRTIFLGNESGWF